MGHWEAGALALVEWPLGYHPCDIGKMCIRDRAEAARKAEERLKYMTFYSTTQDCLRGFLLHYFCRLYTSRCV